MSDPVHMVIDFSQAVDNSVDRGHVSVERTGTTPQRPWTTRRRALHRLPVPTGSVDGHFRDDQRRSRLSTVSTNAMTKTRTSRVRPNHQGGCGPILWTTPFRGSASDAGVLALSVSRGRMTPITTTRAWPEGRTVDR